MQNCVLVLFDTAARSVYWVWLIAVVVGFHRDTRRDAESTEPPLSRRPYTALTACAYVARASRGPSAKPRMLLLRCSGVDRTQKRLANKKNLTKSTWHSEIVNIVEFNGKWTRDSFFPYHFVMNKVAHNKWSKNFDKRPHRRSNPQNITHSPLGILAPT